jgi:hypothetical protein
MIESLMPLNQPSLLPAVGSGLLKTAGAVVAFGYVYPHVVTVLTHAGTFVTHLLNVAPHAP